MEQISIQDALQHAGRADVATRVIPVAFTLMNCRDAYRSAEQRVARITNIQPGFRPVEYWTYVGGGGVSMLTVCGVFENWPAPTE